MHKQVAYRQIEGPFFLAANFIQTDHVVFVESTEMILYFDLVYVKLNKEDRKNHTKAELSTPFRLVTKISASYHQVFLILGHRWAS